MWLLVDTSSARAVVSVYDGTTHHQVSVVGAREHAERLPSMTTEACDQAGITMDELTAIAVGRGPGSFVGIRVAMSFTKGIACALGLPLVGVSSLLACLAEPGDALVCLDARRQQLFVRSRNIDDAALDYEEASKLSQSYDVVVTNMPEHFAAHGNVVCTEGPSASGMAWQLPTEIADERLSLVPIYARSPDAKKPLLPPRPRSLTSPSS